MTTVNVNIKIADFKKKLNITEYVFPKPQVDYSFTLKKFFHANASMPTPNFI